MYTGTQGFLNNRIKALKWHFPRYPQQVCKKMQSVRSREQTTQLSAVCCRSDWRLHVKRWWSLSLLFTHLYTHSKLWYLIVSWVGMTQNIANGSWRWCVFSGTLFYMLSNFNLSRWFLNNYIKIDWILLDYIYIKYILFLMVWSFL